VPGIADVGMKGWHLLLSYRAPKITQKVRWITLFWKPACSSHDFLVSSNIFMRKKSEYGYACGTQAAYDGDE
jgi:hypothetical protein